MDEHDLARLGDEDFEAVCKDLLEELLGIRFEIFARGPDEGVDLRGTDAGGGTVIAQCKHWWRSPGSALVRHVEQVERAKVARLAPARYLLVTTCDLTVGTKDRLYALLAPYAHSPADVLGRKEVAAELRARPHVVARHPRLWFSGAEALAAVLGRGQRDRELARDIAATLRVYVPGRGFREARDLLDRRRVCLISGPAGYGKTTLAHALAATYAARGYEVVAVTTDTLDLGACWADGHRQVFLYDDFLGRTLRDHRHAADGGRLARFVQRVAGTPGKRLVLTTREHVLAGAREADGDLAAARLDLLTHTVTLDAYDEETRAAIVASHVAAAAALPDDVRAALTEPGMLRRIAAHRSFNPRLVAATITTAALGFTPPERLAHDLLDNLDRDRGPWFELVEKQLDDAAYDLLAVLFSFGAAVPGDHVQQAWQALRRHAGRGTDTRELRRAGRLLEGLMIRTGDPEGPAVVGPSSVGFHNGSVADFADGYFGADHALLVALLDSAPYFAQVEGVWEAVCPALGPAPPAAAALAEPLLRALRRTYGSPASGLWHESRYLRVALVAEVVAALGGEAGRDLLRECLAGLEVVFEHGADEAGTSGVGLVVATFLQTPGVFDAELAAWLLPAVDAIEEGAIDAVHALAALLAEQGALPAPVRRAATARIEAEIERAVALGRALDLDTAAALAEAGQWCGLAVPRGWPTP